MMGFCGMEETYGMEKRSGKTRWGNTEQAWKSIIEGKPPSVILVGIVALISWDLKVKHRQEMLSQSKHFHRRTRPARNGIIAREGAYN